MYHTEIMKGDFKVEVTVSDAVKGKVVDAATMEEYVLVHMPSRGEYVNTVRQAYIQCLEDIARHCFQTMPFLLDQSNRIAAWIQQTYTVEPEFLWEKFPGNGVFRNPKNQKWFGIILPVDQKILNGISAETEVCNVKVEPDQIPILLEQPGIYPAYHMNKKSWISIQMNDVLSDKQLQRYIKESYDRIAGPEPKETEWLIPSNPKYYDIIRAFSNDPIQIWKQVAHIHADDLVYMYVGAPYSAILYKCRVLETDIPYEYTGDTVSMKKVMRLQRLETYDKGVCPLQKMKAFGIKGVRGQRHMPRSLSQYIEDSRKEK